MSSDEALASRARRLSAWQADRAALLGQADAFVVVSWWQQKSSDGRTGDYEYEHRPTLNVGPVRSAFSPSRTACQSVAASRPRTSCA